MSESEERLIAQIVMGLTATLALGLLAMALGPHKIGDYFTETDFYGAYAEGARLIQQGHLLPARYGVIGPGYEVLLALAGFVVHDLFLAAELFSIAAAALTLWLWFDLVRRRLDARAALGTVLFLVTNPYFFRYGYAATTDAVAMALQAIALWFLLTRAGDRAMVIAGAVSALAFLTRYNAVYLLPAGIVMILGGAAARAAADPASAPAPRPERRPRAALLFIAGFFAPVVPWVLYSLSHGAKFSFQLHHNIAYEVFARSKGIVWDDYQRDLQPQFKNLWDVIRRDPPAVFSRMAFNLFDHLRLDAQKLLGWPVALCVLAGILVAARARMLARLWPIGVAALLLFLTLVPAFYSERYSLPLAPMYATLAGAAIGLTPFAFALGRSGRVWLKALIAAVPLLLVAGRSVSVQLRTIDQLPVEVVEDAAVLRKLAHPGDKVIARKPHLAFHSGVQSLPFPFTQTIPGLADYARKNGARWLFISYPEVETRPRYWHLLDTTGVMPGLTVRHVTQPHSSVLYEIGPEFGTLPSWYSNDTTLSWHTARAQLMVTPRDTRAMFELALVENARGHLAEARAHLQRAAAIAPRDLHVRLLLGEIALRENDAARATEAFRQALAIDDGSVDATIGLGWASLLAGQEQDAASVWRPVVGRTRDPTTLRLMMQVFQRLGDAQSGALAEATLRQIGGKP